MPEEILAKLNTFLTDNERVSKSEFNQLVKMVTEYIRKTQEVTEAELSAIRSALDTLRQQIQEENTGALSQMQSKVDQVFVGDKLNEMGSKIDMSLTELKQTISTIVDRKLKDVDNKLSTVKDGRSFTFEDLTEDQKEELRGEPGKPDNGAILALKKELDDLKEALKTFTKGSISGGVTNMRITQAFKYILKSETPVGDLDGVNTSYTVTQPIFAILSFALNGEVIHPGNYTVANRTVTFTSALPAAYSGKDFNIKYV